MSCFCQCLEGTCGIKGILPTSNVSEGFRCEMFLWHPGSVFHSQKALHSCCWCLLQKPCIISTGKPGSNKESPNQITLGFVSECKAWQKKKKKAAFWQIHKYNALAFSNWLKQHTDEHLYLGVHRNVTCCCTVHSTATFLQYIELYCKLYCKILCVQAFSYMDFLNFLFLLCM